jgi:hypothetical protein
MTTPIPVERGVRALRGLLRERTFDLRQLDVAGFRRWLERHLSHWERDPVFQQRSRIRDLRRAHPELIALEKEHRRAVAADAAAPEFARLGEVEQELFTTGKALAGLSDAIAGAAAERRQALIIKQDGFQARQQELQAEQAGLLRTSPARQVLLRLDAELHQLRAAIGLDREEATLQQLLKQHGRHSGRSGATFEEETLSLTQQHILPEVLRERAAQGVHILTKVTLGAARTEFDQLVVRPARRPDQPVEVLALIEVKRNINDLAHGFRRRQENLAWLTGDTVGYDPEQYRTKHFRTGHFDREAIHEHAGETFRFARRSFRRFRRDAATGLFLNRLYFITRPGDLWGVSVAALSQIGHRVATNDDWEPESDAYLGRLLRGCQSLAEAVETPDVLRTYAAAPRRGRCILLAGR